MDSRPLMLKKAMSVADAAEAEKSMHDEWRRIVGSPKDWFLGPETMTRDFNDLTNLTKFDEEMCWKVRSEMKTIVYWDVDDFRIPDGYDVDSFLLNIRKALSTQNYTGPVFLIAYGDVSKLPSNIHQQLLHAAADSVDFIDLPGGEGTDRYSKLLPDGAFYGPLEANLLLISNDEQHPLIFGSRQRFMPYLDTILLAVSRRPTDAAFIRAANYIWLWTEIVAGGSPLPSDSVSDWLNQSSAQLPPCSPS